jgi:hypothetical protein
VRERQVTVDEQSRAVLRIPEQWNDVIEPQHLSMRRIQTVARRQ